MNWAPYEGARRCTSGPTPGARALLAWLSESVPGWSGGIFNCRNVRGRSTTSLHGEGRAVDWMMERDPDGTGTAEGWELVYRLGAHGVRLGIQCVIYDRRILSAASPGSRYYDGVAPHYDHAHIELTRAAAERMTLATFRAVLGRDESEDDMTEDQDRILRETYNNAVWAKQNTEALAERLSRVEAAVYDGSGVSVVERTRQTLRLARVSAGGAIRGLYDRYGLPLAWQDGDRGETGIDRIGRNVGEQESGKRNPADLEQSIIDAAERQ